MERKGGRISRYYIEGCFQIDNDGVEDNCIFYNLLGSCLQSVVKPNQSLTFTLEKIPLLETPINWDELLPSNSVETKA